MSLEFTGSSSDPTLASRVTNLEGKYVRSTRFAQISSGTSGTVSLPASSTVVLDDFGGTVDAVISQVSGGKPTLLPAKTSSGVVVATTFDSAGNYVLTGAPSAYPVAILYRVRQALKDFDSSASDIIGDVNVETPQGYVDSGTRGSPNVVTSSIPLGTNQRQRIFIASNSGAVVNPTIASGSGSIELLIFGTSDVNTVELNSASNIELSGKWIARNGSVLRLVWDGSSKYTEEARNEI